MMTPETLFLAHQIPCTLSLGHDKNVRVLVAVTCGVLCGCGSAILLALQALAVRCQFPCALVQPTVRKVSLSSGEPPKPSDDEKTSCQDAPSVETSVKTHQGSFQPADYSPCAPSTQPGGTSETFTFLCRRQDTEGSSDEEDTLIFVHISDLFLPWRNTLTCAFLLFIRTIKNRRVRSI